MWAVVVAAVVSPVVVLFGVLVYGRWISPGKASKRSPGELKKVYGEWALITGASAGIGEEFGRQLAAERFNLILVARRKEKLETFAEQLRQEFGIETEVYSCDLSTQQGPYDLHQHLQNKGYQQKLGFFVNNAGLGWFGDFEKQQPSLIEQMIQLNITSVAVLTRLIIEDMMTKRQNQRSGIIITSSIGAHFPGPLSALYNATKVFDRFLSLAIWREQTNKPASELGRVDVISLEPGSTSTEFSQVAGSRSDIIRTSPAVVVSSCLDHLLARYPAVIPVDKDYLMTWLIVLSPYAVTQIAFNAFKNLMGSKAH
jgi:hypothetical protein